jgi:hypothetical protein
MKEQYFVEVDENGCSKCCNGRTWTIIGPDGDGVGKSFHDEEYAEEISEMLNRAYYFGKGGKKRRG